MKKEELSSNFSSSEILNKMLKREKPEPIISALLNEIEETRFIELNKALCILGKIDDDRRKVVEELTRILVNHILHYPMLNLREVTEKGEDNSISTVEKLFNIQG